MSTEQRTSAVQPLASALTAAVDHLGLHRRLQRANVLRQWDRVVGPHIASHARPWRLRGSELWVMVNHPGWAQHLMFLKASIVRKLNGAVGEPIVQDLRFIAGNLPQSRRATWQGHSSAGPDADPGPPGTPAGRPVDDGALTALTARLAVVRDGDVREAAGRWLRAAWWRRQQALGRGWPVCCRCGSPFAPSGAAVREGRANVCGACRAQEEDRARHRIRALLLRQPWLSASDIAKLEGPGAVRLFREERAALLTEWRTVLLSHVRRIQKDGAPPPEAKMLLISYALLRSGLSPDQLDTGVVYQAVGPRLRALCDHFFGEAGTTRQGER